jgi:molecular chaperone HtpG
LECTDAEYLEFYHSLYPVEPDPIFWIHLNVDYPFHLKAILYFPKITRRFDWNQNTIKLFCNRVFVSDHCKDLIPDYLMILRGAIDSPDIPLNVSRSTLQMDRTVRQLSQHISKKVSDRLSTLYSSDRDKFQKAWPDIEMIIKLGILQDDKFYERSKDFLIWKNMDGEWTSAAEYLERHKEEYKGKIFYGAEDQRQSHVLDLYKQKGIEILSASSLVDTPLINLLEDKMDGVKFQRIDGAIDEILDASREKTLLDPDGRTESFKIADFIRAKLGSDTISVEAKSLSTDSVPALLIVDEEMRRMRETMSLAQQTLPPNLSPKRTFVVNTNNKLVQSIYRLKEKDPGLAKEMVHHLYELSLLSQRELEPAALSQFITRSNQILEKIAQFL